MKITQKIITPEIASKFLEYNVSNRPILKQHVKKLAADMVADRWETTHQGIAIAGTIERPVRLLDGQHRLSAIIQSNKPVLMLVCENMTEEAFKHIDAGKTRTLHYRLEEDPFIVECANFAAHNAKRLGEQEFIEKILPELKVLSAKFTKTTKRKLTTKAVRLVFFMEQKTNENAHILYGDFVNQRYEKLSASLLHVMRRILNNKLKDFEIFYLVYKAVKNPDMKTIPIPVDVFSFTADTIREFFNQ
jgi:succinate dehydrogenase flavin-adding protein (antitoxin of CptAB toxin-antitoxin module)